MGHLCIMLVAPSIMPHAYMLNGGIIDRRYRLGERSQRPDIPELYIGSANPHLVRCQGREATGEDFRRHAEAGREDLLPKWQHEAPLGTSLAIAREQPVSQPLEAGSQLLVLQLFDQRAVSVREFLRQGASESGVSSEDLTHSRTRKQQHACRRQRPSGLQIHLV